MTAAALLAEARAAGVTLRLCDGTVKVGGAPSPEFLASLRVHKSELASLLWAELPPLPYPPEPLRTLAVRAVTRSLRRVDAGEKPGMLLRILDRLGIGFSS